MKNVAKAVFSISLFLFLSACQEDPLSDLQIDNADNLQSTVEDSGRDAERDIDD